MRWRALLGRFARRQDAEDARQNVLHIILEKLGMRDRTEPTKYAIRVGLVEP